MPGQAAGAQDGAVQLPAAALEGLFGADCEVLLYDLRSHTSRCDSARRPASAAWLQPRQTIGLCSGGDRLDRDAGRLAACLRGDGGKHLGQDALRDFIKRIETQYGMA